MNLIQDYGTYFSIAAMCLGSPIGGAFASIELAMLLQISYFSMYPKWKLFMSILSSHSLLSPSQAPFQILNLF